MGVAFSLVAVPGLFGSAIAFALAWLVYSAQPRRFQNRVLAVSLFLEAMTVLAGTSLMYLTDDVRSAFAWQIATFATWGALPALELMVISTLNVPFTAWLRRPLVRGAIAIAAVGLAALPLARPDLFVAAMVPGLFSPWEAVVGPAFPVMVAAVLAVFVVATLAGVSAMRRAPRGSPERFKAKGFAIAFAARSVMPALLLLLLGGALVLDPIVFAVGYSIVPPVIFVGFTVTLAYAILRTQVFDIDLKVKWTVSRGTVAAVFVGVFFVASELAQRVFEAWLGPIVGILAAGALVFAMAPLQRLGAGVAEAAMPRTQDTDEYRLVRKREVYRAAFESAMLDGAVTERERDMLASLQDSLGLAALEAREVERQALAAKAAP